MDSYESISLQGIEKSIYVIEDYLKDIKYLMALHLIMLNSKCNIVEAKEGYKNLSKGGLFDDK